MQIKVILNSFGVKLVDLSAVINLNNYLFNVHCSAIPDILSNLLKIKGFIAPHDLSWCINEIMDKWHIYYKNPRDSFNGIIQTVRKVLSLHVTSCDVSMK